jgi:hypothetical protein
MENTNRILFTLGSKVWFPFQLIFTKLVIPEQVCCILTLLSLSKTEKYRKWKLNFSCFGN